MEITELNWVNKTGLQSFSSSLVDFSKNNTPDDSWSLCHAPFLKLHSLPIISFLFYGNSRSLSLNSTELESFDGISWTISLCLTIENRCPYSDNKLVRCSFVFDPNRMSRNKPQVLLYWNFLLCSLLGHFTQAIY